jgi:maltose O-acetyltransferase
MKKISYLYKYIALLFYYSIFRFLPSSTFFVGGSLFKQLRFIICRPIFQSCGKNVNIERLATFGNGFRLQIGDNSGLGRNCKIPSDTIIGKDVMMGPNVCILATNHKFDRLDIPMCKQGVVKRKQTIIEDDIWIGMQVIFTPGRTVKKGTIVAAGTVLTKDFPEYSIVGGNPAKLIRSRIEIQEKTR